MKDFNKFYVNPVVGCGDNDKVLTMLIDDDFDLTLKSESNVYVVYNEQAKILYRGDMCHCYLYSKIYRKYNGFWPEISSIEYYNDMMKTITENQKDPKSFWDYLGTINKDTDEWDIVFRIGEKFHKEGKNPDNYLDEIIEEANKKLKK